MPQFIKKLTPKRALTLVSGFIALLLTVIVWYLPAAPVQVQSPQEIVVAVNQNDPFLVRKSKEQLAVLTKGIVTKVADGDTITVLVDDAPLIIRYIGMDTPEIVHGNLGRNQPYGQEAKIVNEQFVFNKTVFLEKDVTDTDKYKRFLRYVYLEDGTQINYLLLRLGYAQVLTIPPNVAYHTIFLEAQRQARDEKLGLWKLQN